MEAYAAYVVQAAKVVRDSIDGRSSDSDIAREVEQMIYFQIELAKVRSIWLNASSTYSRTKVIYFFKIQTKPEERRNRTRMYNSMKLNELQRLTDSINRTTSVSHVE